MKLSNIFMDVDLPTPLATRSVL